MDFIRENLTVSVDDYGIRSVADSILPLVRQGKIDRVSVLIDYITSPEQVQELKDSGVQLDLHLDLTSLIKSGKKMQENALFRGVNFIIRYIFGFVSSEKAEKVWIGQIERFQVMFGRLPDGLNSHEHVHYFPRFFRVATKLAEQYHIPFIRYGYSGILEKNTSFTSLVLSFLQKCNRLEYKRICNNHKTTGFFVSYDWIKDFDRFLRNAPKDKTEITFHPEREDEYNAIERYF